MIVPQNKTVLPSTTDIAAVYGLLNIEARKRVREECQEEYNIPIRTFYNYLRTNRIPVKVRSKISKSLAIVLMDTTNFKWDI